MFYLKFRGRKLNIWADNVFTICPDCGREHNADLQDILSGGDADLYSTAVYCPDCAKKRSPYTSQRRQTKEV